MADGGDNLAALMGLAHIGGIDLVKPVLLGEGFAHVVVESVDAFLGVGVLAALAGLIPSLTSMASDASSADTGTAWMATQLGMALRASAWGFICAIGASLSGRLIEGAFDARSHGLDELVESAFGSVSPGELAEITRQTQQKSLETLGSELSRFANELNERLDRGLQRIEQSTARSANLVSQ